MEELRDKIPPFAKDLALNLSSVLGDGALDERTRWGVALACAFATESKPLRDALGPDAVRIAGDAIVDDAHAAAALMAMNNVYYRFRHFVGKPSYAQKPARLRMTRIAKPASDKTTFELMCLAVSAINGCEACVRAHEATLEAAGVTEDAVHDAVRIAATIRGVAAALA
ncbi:MAG TPA: carboxymuconolactone decarboxylase family protein [Polyangiaceae bacterium]|jgi:alkyl hydroperoxide reductase subunit D